MSAVAFRQPADALARRLAAFHRRDEIVWLGLRGAYETAAARVHYARPTRGHLGGGGRAALNGGVIACGFDAACVLAALGHADGEVVATLTLQIQYLRLAAPAEGLLFRAEVVKSARTVLFAQAALVDPARPGTLLATATAMLTPMT